MSQSQSQAPPTPTHVSSACYPIAQPLATILQAATSANANGASANSTSDSNPTTSSSSTLELDAESQADALQHLINNSFVAMDDMYFAT